MSKTITVKISNLTSLDSDVMAAIAVMHSAGLTTATIDMGKMKNELNDKYVEAHHLSDCDDEGVVVLTIRDSDNANKAD